MQIITRMNVGGPAAHVVMIDRELRAEGFETLLVHGRVGPGETSVNGDLTSIRQRTVFIGALGPRIRVAQDLLAFGQLLRLVWRFRPAVVHTHTSKAGTLGRLAVAACNRFRPRHERSLVVHTFHGNIMSGYYGRFGSAAVRTIERCLGAATDRVIAISPGQQRELAERFRVVPRAKIAQIALGVDLEPLADPVPARDAGRVCLGFGPEDIVLLFAGRLVPVKNLPVLLDAFSRVVARLPHARLILAGDGVCRSALEAQARALGVARLVRFTGRSDDMSALYRVADIGVLASRNEGTPLFLIEAMAAGLPVVATAVGGVADVVRNEITGLLVPPDRPEDLAEAMVRLGMSETTRRRLGESARREVIAGDRFRPERLRRELAQLYLTGLEEVRGRAARAAVVALVELPAGPDGTRPGGLRR
ncbi:MAG: glycosyltransferase [Acidobacteria bacterium]|nr:glycosyltransferase [Acidobacteriota bacterium]